MKILEIPWPGVELMLKSVESNGDANIFISLHAGVAWTLIPARVPYAITDDRMMKLPEGVVLHDVTARDIVRAVFAEVQTQRGLPLRAIG